MGLSDGFKRLFGKGGSRGSGQTTFAVSKTFTHRHVVRNGVEVTDQAELDALVEKIEGLSDAVSTSETERNWGPLNIATTETTRIVDGPEDLGDPAVREALEGVVDELRAKGLGEAASGIAEMLAQAQDGHQPSTVPVAPEPRPSDTASRSSEGAPSAPTPPTPPDHV